MAGKYGSASVTVTLENAPGGTAKDIHNFILNGITAKQMSEMHETTALGDSAREYTPAGMTDTEPFTLQGIWDTTATSGSHAILGAVDDGPQDDTRNMVITFGDSKTYTVDTRLESYAVIAQNGQIQTFEVVLRPTGAGAWGP